MRMWMVDPETMCKQHLLGEHVELHMIEGNYRKGRSLAGYKELIEMKSLRSRHEMLVEEMLKRGWNHHSQLHNGYQLPNFGKVNRMKSVIALHQHCKNCRQLWAEKYGDALR